MWAGTFRAIGTRLLREYAERIGFDPAFTIHDREDLADPMNLSGMSRNFPKLNVVSQPRARTAARCHPQPRLVQGRQRVSLQMRLVAFLAAVSRGAAAIMIVYRLYGER